MEIWGIPFDSGWTAVIVAIFAIIVSFFLWYYSERKKDFVTFLGPDETETRAEILAQLKTPTLGRRVEQAYARGVSTGLKKAANFFGPAWSVRAFFIAAHIALAYPLVLSFLSWLVTNENTSGLEGFYNPIDLWRRDDAIA